MKKSRCFQSGVTLVELLVAISISVLVTGAVVTIFVISNRSYNIGSSSIDAMQNARTAAIKITRELRETPEIISNLPDIQPGASSIKFQNPKNTNYEYIEYYLSEDNMMRTVSHYYIPGDPDTWVKYNTPGSLSSAHTEYFVKGITKFELWGKPLISIDISTNIKGEQIDLSIKVYGQNL